MSVKRMESSPNSCSEDSKMMLDMKGEAAAKIDLWHLMVYLIFFWRTDTDMSEMENVY